MRIYRHLTMVGLGLAFGCKSLAKEPVVGPDPTPTASTSATASAANKVSVTLTSSTKDAKSSFAPGGGITTPKIELTFSVANMTNAAVTCLAEADLKIEAERSKTNKRARIELASKIDVAAMSIGSKTGQAGKPLVDVASLYMKGDTLHVIGVLKCSAGSETFDVTSNEVVIHVFVPEG